MKEDGRVTEGSCRCGQVRMKLKGKPALTMACHCTGCQKMTASAFSLSAFYPFENFEVSGLEPVIGGLHGDLDHYCCPHCLSWLFTRAERMGPFVNVRPTMFENARSFIPFIESQTAEKLSWATTPAVHSFERFPPPDSYPALITEFAASGFAD
ncbi:GFA family protein [Agrobacterium sp. ES01]|uniref:GFA family protein n=1 Tax=Agrobacterium sp. ES01 TaxID=3420714 RepID=UPI003D09862F